jgi:hypothetical protein
MNEIEKRFRNRIVLMAGCGGVALLLLGWGLAKGALQARTFGIVCLVLWGVMFVAFMGIMLLYRRADAEFRKTESASGIDLTVLDRERMVKSVRSLKQGIAFMVLLLPYGLWQTRGVPWPPRVAGVAANLLVTGTLAIYLVRAKKKLNGW